MFAPNAFSHEWVTARSSSSRRTLRQLACMKALGLRMCQWAASRFAIIAFARLAPSSEYWASRNTCFCATSSTLCSSSVVFQARGSKTRRAQDGQFGGSTTRGTCAPPAAPSSADEAAASGSAASRKRVGGGTTRGLCAPPAEPSASTVVVGGYAGAAFFGTAVCGASACGAACGTAACAACAAVGGYGGCFGTAVCGAAWPASEATDEAADEAAASGSLQGGGGGNGNLPVGGGGGNVNGGLGGDAEGAFSSSTVTISSTLFELLFGQTSTLTTLLRSWLFSSTLRMSWYQSIVSSLCVSLC